MRVCEWEKGVSQNKYDSPTNIQLFEHLKNNETYNILLKKSESIMQEKMAVEFDIQRKKAETIKENINKNYAELTRLSRNLSLLEKKLLRLTDIEEISETKKNIADTKYTYDRKHKEIMGSIKRNLKKVCWDFSNLYYAYMTLSMNYSVYANDMYMCTINNYFSLFSILKSLHNASELRKIFLEETDEIMKDISRYVDVQFVSSDTTALLSTHPRYYNAIYESGNYLINFFDTKTDILVEETTNLLSLGEDAEQE